MEKRVEEERESMGQGGSYSISTPKHPKAKYVLFSCLKTVDPMTFLPHSFVTGEQDRVAA